MSIAPSAIYSTDLAINGPFLFYACLAAKERHFEKIIVTRLIYTFSINNYTISGAALNISLVFVSGTDSGKKYVNIFHIKNILQP